MSRENVKKFMELAKAEESLAKRMVALKDGLQEGEFNFKNDKEFVEKKVLPLAKEYGIEFSVEDFVEFTKSQLVELSDEDLSSVSGGLITEFFLSLLAVGGINLAGNAVHAAVSSYFTGGGTSTSTVQSVTDKEVGMSDAKTGAIVDLDFKRATNYLSEQIKDAFNNINSYMSPEARSTWMEENANKEYRGEQRKLTDKKVYAKYDKNKDVVTFTASWTDRLNDFIFRSECSRGALNNKLSNILNKLYDEGYCAAAMALFKQRNECDLKLKQTQDKKAGDEAKRNKLIQDNANLQGTVEHCCNKLIDVCDALIKNNPSNDLFQQWKKALQKKEFSSWDALKTQADRYTITENGQQYKYSGYVDTLLSTIQQIQNNNNKISQLQYSVQQAQFEINSINNQRGNIVEQLRPYEPAQNVLVGNMKTEFEYFSDKLFVALNEDTEIKALSAKANTSKLKTELAIKIKEKADQLVQEQFSKQLLDGCSLVVEQQDASIKMNIIYRGYRFHQSSFSVDDFISEQNHLEIINSEASKKRDEVAKKLAEYIKGHYTNVDNKEDLESTIKSVFNKLESSGGKLTIKDAKGTETTVDLGIQIVDLGNDHITFTSASGSEKRETVLTFARIANEYNKMVNMQAIEATRQQNEGNIEYTPFGRKLWNSIGSQAQHVLDTLNQIKNLSDVKNREAFENDLKYVAGKIVEVTKGGTVSDMHLAGEYRSDYSFKRDDLQKIKDFAKKTEE